MSKKSTKLSDQIPDSDKKEKAIGRIQEVFQNMMHVMGLVNALLPNTPIDDQTEKVFNTVRSIVIQSNRRILILQEVEGMTRSIIELSKFIAEAKATNPLISDELVNDILTASKNAQIALTLTKEASA
jgi:hypothetical protein